MMATALGPPEVIAQLENAAKVLMVRTPRPRAPGPPGPLAGPDVSGLAARGLAPGKGLRAALEVE